MASDFRIPDRCNFLIARDGVASFFRLANKEGEREGGQYVFPTEVADAWYQFRDDPCSDTAHKLLNVSPMLSLYFEASYAPIGKIAEGIVLAAYNTQRGLASVLGFNFEDPASESRILIVYELFYFFSHLTLRSAVSTGFTRMQIEKLQERLWPITASTVIDIFFGHWPEERKEKMQHEFYEKLNDAEVEYSECTGLLPMSEPFDRNTLLGRLANNIAELQGKPNDPIIELAVVVEAHKALEGIQLNRLVSEAKAAIDPIQGEKSPTAFLPDFGLWHTRNGSPKNMRFTFYQFPLYSLTIVGAWKYTTIVEKPIDGELHSLSLDLDQKCLDFILTKASEEIRKTIIDELTRDPVTPRTLDFKDAVIFGVHAYLGELQHAPKEDFVPLVADEVF